MAPITVIPCSPPPTAACDGLKTLRTDLNRAYGTSYPEATGEDLRQPGEVNCFVAVGSDGIKGAVSMEGAFSAPLLGATTLFAPRQDEGEATFLLPPQNRDEVFSQLLGAVKGELARRGVGSLLFTVDKKDTPLGDILRRRGTPYEFSEFFLEYVPGSEKTSDNPGNGITEVSLIPATLEDLSALAAINAEAFDGDVDTTLALFRNIIAQEDRQLFSICHESKKVGTVGIMEEQTQRYLFALAVKPALQGRGIGKAVLDRMVKRYGPGKKSLVLEVETKNTSALGLYKSSGFSVRSEFCYYRERIE